VLAGELLQHEIAQNGFAIRENVLSAQYAAQLAQAIGRIDQEVSARKRGGVFAVRNLLDESDEVRELSASQCIRELVEPILGSEFFPVRGILFDKIPDANWKVPWHQDVTIAVREKVEAEGFGPWSMKAGVLHAQPPAYVLESMVSVRLHLDPCAEENGALRVISGSHRLGRIPEESIAVIRETAPEIICAVATGGALLMRPLLLHASSPSQTPDHRRVIHIDYASVQLPGGMAWFHQTA
jgi:ectoine hydroxylase-related dioxygenase (phytanoyl-CoA dioxygenase family)